MEKAEITIKLLKLDVTDKNIHKKETLNSALVSNMIIEKGSET